MKKQNIINRYISEQLNLYYYSSGRLLLYPPVEKKPLEIKKNKKKTKRLLKKFETFGRKTAC